MTENSPDDSPRPQHPPHDDDRRHRGPPPGLALDPPDFAPAHAPEIAVERLDPDALRTISRLRHMGHEAYLVGGCVRDLLLDQKPKDFDVATSAHPGEVRAVFRNCRLIGRRFRLAHVYFRGGKVIEVATFRKNPTELPEEGGDEGDLLITRDNVFGTAEEDAVRRDFTVNGLFYDPATGEVIDFVGGREDLEAHRISTIGDPEIRMREDPVRALRAIRFAARLGFTIEPDTFEAMRRHAGELARCAPPRLLEEVFKILRCGGAARAFELMRAANALPVVLPSLAAAIDQGGEPRRRSFFQHLTALDRLVRRGEEVSDAVLLGALLVHLAPAAAQGPAAEGPEPAVGADGAVPDAGGPSTDEAGRLLEQLVQTSRLPRKAAERTRLALHAQRALREPARKRRRRGRGLAGQPHFADALQLLEIAVEATGQGRELLERWTGDGADHPRRPAEERHKPVTAPGGEPVAPFEAAEAEEVEAEEVELVEVADGAEGAEPGTGAPAAAEGDRPRRRRRRGGRRRRRRGAEAGSGEGGGGDGVPVP
jgi:poly(A) polymerase